MADNELIHDKEIREPLFDYLEETYGKIRILEEKMMGRSRADVVMVTEDAMYGIEIKSDADTYARLARQVKDNDKYYDRNIIVAGKKHAHSIKEHVPECWGIINRSRIFGSAMEQEETEVFRLHSADNPARMRSSGGDHHLIQQPTARYHKGMISPFLYVFHYSSPRGYIIVSKNK